MTSPAVLHSLARAPGLSLAVIGTLALGIGALGTTFSLVDAALWRQPPFPDADRLAILYLTRTTATVPEHRLRWPYRGVTALRDLSRDFLSVSNFSRQLLTLTGTGDPEPLEGEVVAPAYFPILGVGALKGRTFVAAEDSTPGTHPVVILGFDLWQRRFAGDAGLVGRTVRLNGVPLTVVGVMPQGFRGLSGVAQFWTPAMMAPSLSYADYLTTDQNFISVVARLRPGIDLAAARTRMAALGTRINALRPDAPPDSGERVSGTAVSLNEARVDRVVRRSLLILGSAVALVFLLACANAMNLLLGRATSRRREAAVRAALGGGYGHLLRHFLAEGVVLVLSGGAFGLLISWWASHVIQSPVGLLGPGNFYGAVSDFADPTFGWRHVAFVAALTLATILLVAWAPAAGVTRSGIAAGLREGERGASAAGGTLLRPTMRGGIVALESALAVLLLIGGGLLIDSFMKMRRTDLGIDSSHVLTFWLRPSDVTVPVAAAPAFIGKVLEAIERVPGVEAASVDGGAPVSGTARSTLFIQGRPAPPPELAPPVLRHYIAPDHFKVLGVPLREGRVFTDADRAGSPRVAIISESAARHFWRGGNPIGQRVWFGGGSSFDRPDSSAEIIGIVGDVMHEPLANKPNLDEFYTPYMQFTYSSRVVMVRTAGDPIAIVPAIRRAVQSVDPDLPLSDIQSMDDRIGNSWSRQRFDALLFGGFAALGLLLATSGIYAVVSYAVSMRTREMGIRLALGATAPAVIRLVVREGMGFPAAGLVAGAVAAFMFGGALRGVLYQVSPTDPGVFAGALGLLLAVSLVACFVPARRATRVDPLVALRAD
jgi:putative ABC transport system permease protein